MIPLNHFTTRAKEAIRRAHELAIERGQTNVQPMHLLASLLTQEDSLVVTMLERMGVDFILMTDNAFEAIDSGETSNTLSPAYQLFLTPELASIIESSGKISAQVKDNFVSVEHLFIAFFETMNPGRELIEKFKINQDQCIETLEALKSQKNGGVGAAQTGDSKKAKALTKYTRNLTALAREHKLDPVIGRDVEIGRVIQILSRRTKNNLILLGEAGVGITAIV